MRKLAIVVFLALPTIAEAGTDAASAEKEGRALLAKRAYAEARAQFAVAREGHAGARKPVAAAHCLVLLGRCLEGERRFDQAADAFRRGHEELHRLEGDSPELCDSILATGWRFLQLGRSREAEPMFLAAVEMARRLGPRDTRLARCLNRHGYSLHLLARSDQGLITLNEALALWHEIHEGDHADTAHTMSNLGACLADLGRTGEAVEMHQATLAMRRRLSRGAEFDVASSLNNLAAALDDQGLCEDALRIYREFLAMARRLIKGDHVYVATGLGNEACALRRLGRLAEALPIFEQSLDMWQRLAKRGYASEAQVANARNNVANCMRHLGRPEDALPQLEKALAGWKRAYRGDHHRIVIGHCNVAKCLLSAGHEDEALARFREALAMAQRISPGDHPQVAKRLGEVGGCLVITGRPKAGSKFTGQAVAMWKRLYDGDHPDVFPSLTLHAHALRALGRTERALAANEQAIAMARRLESPFKDRALTAAAECQLELGRTKRAVILLEEAIQQLENRRRSAASLTDTDRAAFFGELKRASAFSLMQRAQLALGDDAAALGYVEQARARSLLDLLARGRSDPLQEVRAKAEADGDKGQLERIDEIIGSLDRIDTVVARLNVSLAKETHKAAAKARQILAGLAAARREREDVLRRRARLVRRNVPIATPADPAALQSLAGRDGHVLVYAVSGKQATLFHVPAAGAPIKAHTLSVTARELEVMVVAVGRDAGSNPGRGVRVSAPRSDRSIARRLFSALMPDAVWRAIQTARVVYIVPDGALHRLSFEGLATGSDGVWLETGPPVVYGASGTALLWSRQRRAQQASQKRLDEVVLVGEPNFGDLQPLPGTRQEVAAIREALPGATVTVLLGAEATRPALRRLAQRARYLHIATHGIADETATTSSSRLALTLPAIPTAEDDGFLNLSDLLTRWRNRLDRCELVVLSACRTQQGSLQKDEAVMALPVGFLYAGAPTVIATLSLVDDATTAELMADFYARLARGEPKLAAFGAARKAVRKKRPEPRYWAPFIYIGAR